MYSPKIKEDYIPLIYKIAKENRRHMTDLVNDAIHEYLSNNQNHRKLKDYQIDHTSRMDNYYILNSKMEATAIVTYNYDFDRREVEIVDLSSNGCGDRELVDELEKIIREYLK